MVVVPVTDYVSNYQNKIFFNGGTIHNLRDKIITSLQLFTNNEIDYVNGSPVIDVTATNFSTYLTLVGKDGTVILNLMPMSFLYNYNHQEETTNVLRQFLMIIDWPKSYLLLVWNVSPAFENMVISIMVGYADYVSQLPFHVKEALK